MTHLRLFKIYAQYFQEKRYAKLFRDEINIGGAGAVVMRGPDHWRGESFNVSKQTQSSKRRIW